MFPLLARSACARTGVSPLAAMAARQMRFQAAIMNGAVRYRTTMAGRGVASPVSGFASSTHKLSSSSAVAVPTASYATATSADPATTPATEPTTTPAAPDFYDRYLPKWAAGAKPYLQLMRFHSQIGTALLYWPTAWSTVMASTFIAASPTTPLWFSAVFLVGSISMRGAGCVINDMWDAKMDAKVERTKTRPLAAGTVSYKGATFFLGSQLLIGLAVLTQLNTYSILLSFMSVPLIALYPYMKRVTYYPQAVLGTVFTWGALVGWSAVAGSVYWPAAGALWFGSFLHCIGYDTIYAHQDKVDDVAAGVKSTALKWGERTKPIVGALYTGFVGCLAFAGHAIGAGPIYYGLSVVGAAAQLAWQVITVNLDSRPDCWNKFCSNGWVLGPMIWLGAFGDYIHRIVLPAFF